MKKLSIYLLALTSLLLGQCTSSSKLVVPTSDKLPNIDNNYSIVWVGSGESYFYNNGEYVRSESDDYAFEVVQRRYGRKWKSIKNMHRIHPDYDGRAGDREQTMFFAIDFSEDGNDIISKITSSLGSGLGTSDGEFRKQRLQLEVDGISSLAPYNTIRITQEYLYEEGQLLEVVELFKIKNGMEIPFVKIEETAYIFRPTSLEDAPTSFY